MTKNQLKNLKFANKGEAASKLTNTVKKMGLPDNAKGMRVNNINRSNAKRVSQQVVQNNSIGAKLGDNMIGGYRDTIKGMKGKPLSINNVKTAANAAFRNADGSMNTGKVIGAAATASVAGRVLSGGGLYRDKYGDVNIPGLPLI
jgi:hypothetical protein